MVQRNERDTTNRCRQSTTLETATSPCAIVSRTISNRYTHEADCLHIAIKARPQTGAPLQPARRETQRGHQTPCYRPAAASRQQRPRAKRRVPWLPRVPHPTQMAVDVPQRRPDVAACANAHRYPRRFVWNVIIAVVLDDLLKLANRVKVKFVVCEKSCIFATL